MTCIYMLIDFLQIAQDSPVYISVGFMIGHKCEQQYVLMVNPDRSVVNIQNEHKSKLGAYRVQCLSGDETSINDRRRITHRSLVPSWPPFEDDESTQQWDKMGSYRDRE